MSTTITTLRLDAIPATMVLVRRWLCWMLVHRGGPKPTKVPIDVYSGEDRSKLDVTQEVTPDGPYGALEEAVAYMRQWGLSGIGFVLGNGWAGVDQDHCFDPATGALAGWALENVRDLDSYTEVSPGGDGVKTVMHGTLPPGRRRKGQIEMYDSGRFFTITGHHLEGTPHSVEERTDALHAVHRRVFGSTDRTRKVRATADAPVLEPSDEQTADLRERAASGCIKRATLALLDSTGAGNYDSPSEADAAIAAGLLNAGLSEREALAVLLDSARGRDAIDRKGQRYGLSYWQRTVAHAADLVGPVTVRADGRRVRSVRLPDHRTFTSVRYYEGRSAR